LGGVVSGQCASLQENASVEETEREKNALGALTSQTRRTIRNWADASLKKQTGRKKRFRNPIKTYQRTTPKGGENKLV